LAGRSILQSLYKSVNPKWDGSLQTSAIDCPRIFHKNSKGMSPQLSKFSMSHLVQKSLGRFLWWRARLKDCPITPRERKLSPIAASGAFLGASNPMNILCHIEPAQAMHMMEELNRPLCIMTF
jgi:hypothetical protein